MLKVIEIRFRLMVSRSGRLLAIALAGLLAGANVLLPIQASGQEFTVSASFADKQSVGPDEQIELRFSRMLEPREGKVAVFIGPADLTSLFTQTGTALAYNPKILPLPPGESELVVYLVSSDNDWKRVARFSLRVSKAAGDQAAEQKREEQQKPDENASAEASSQQAPTNGKKFGFEKLGIIPSLTLNIKSQPAETSFPAANRPERPTFTDLALQSNLKTEIVRGLFNSQTQFDLVGSSFQKEALRFGQLGDSAPRIDLSSYLMQFQAGKVRWLVGHTSFGANRHLINSFSSRGITLFFPIGPRSDFSAAAMNGTNIVGFGNFFGLSKRRHQIVSATLGHEFLAERPGGLRLEVGLLEGWLQPVSNFNQGNINDAERSRGLGLRLLASDPAQRLKLDAGFTRSQFTSPSDPLLNQGADVVALPAVSRNARYFDVSYDILKDFPILNDKKANLTLGYKHERVDPLFRSLGATTQADRIQNEFQLAGFLGGVTAQFSHLRFNDNLASIPSILKSLTRANVFTVAAPLASLLGDPAKPSALFPRLAYSFNQVRQFGAAIPVGGGFELDPSSVPDQVGTVQNLTADWQFQKWRVSYRLSHTFQNNRQKGRELADTTNLINGWTIGITPKGSLDINLEVNAESADNKEANTTDRTLRLAPNINWRISQAMTLASNISTTLVGDAARTKRNRNVELDLQWTYRLAFEKDRFRKAQTQFFIRYANRYGRSRNTIFGLNELTKNQILNLGLSFTFF